MRILQIGDGNFLRGFADWMIDIANQRGVLAARVTIAQPLPRGIAATLAEQDCLYTVLLRGSRDGVAIDEARVVSCVDAAFDPHARWDLALACACDPSLRFVISNTTEAGIAWSDEPLVAERCPIGFPAKVAALLHARFLRFGPDPAKGLVFLPCELIERNGQELRRLVLLHARENRLEPPFIDWVEHHQDFLDTLVDRIVAGFPAAEAGTLAERLGYLDPLLVAAEPFHRWVIQAPARIAEELPLHRAGLDVVWADDLAPHRELKVRILNGAHSACALLGLAAGLASVRQLVDDPLLGRFLRMVLAEEIVPSMPNPAAASAFAESVLERFANPHLDHRLETIALNSASKWRVRVLPSLRAAHRAIGRLAPGLTLSLAALLDRYRRVGTPDSPRDDAAVLDAFADSWRRHAPDRGAYARAILGRDELWGDLADLPGLADAITVGLGRFDVDGARGAIVDIVGG